MDAAPADEPEPAGPAELLPAWPSADDFGDPREIGDFAQGSPASRWALSRYLVGRAIGESIGNTLLLLALAVLGIAAACEWGLGSTFLAILVLLVAIVILLLRAVLRAVLRRFTAVDRYGPLESRMRALVRDTRGDVLRELRRLGLPSHTLTLPLLARRLIGRRRAATLTALRGFDVDRAVPKARLDELHMLLREGLGRA